MTTTGGCTSGDDLTYADPYNTGVTRTCAENCGTPRGVARVPQMEYICQTFCPGYDCPIERPGPDYVIVYILTAIICLLLAILGLVVVALVCHLRRKTRHDIEDVSPYDLGSVGPPGYADQPVCEHHYAKHTEDYLQSGSTEPSIQHQKLNTSNKCIQSRHHPFSRSQSNRSNSSSRHHPSSANSSFCSRGIFRGGFSSERDPSCGLTPGSGVYGSQQLRRRHVSRERSMTRKQATMNRRSRSLGDLPNLQKLPRDDSSGSSSDSFQSSLQNSSPMLTHGTSASAHHRRQNVHAFGGNAQYRNAESRQRLARVSERSHESEDVSADFSPSSLGLGGGLDEHGGKPLFPPKTGIIEHENPSSGSSHRNTMGGSSSDNYPAIVTPVGAGNRSGARAKSSTRNFLLNHPNPPPVPESPQGILDSVSFSSGAGINQVNQAFDGNELGEPNAVPQLSLEEWPPDAMAALEQSEIGESSGTQNDTAHNSGTHTTSDTQRGAHQNKEPSLCTSQSPSHATPDESLDLSIPGINKAGLSLQRETSIEVSTRDDPSSARGSQDGAAGNTSGDGVVLRTQSRSSGTRRTQARVRRSSSVTNLFDFDYHF